MEGRLWLDVKAPVDAYMNAISATSDEEREKALKIIMWLR